MPFTVSPVASHDLDAACRMLAALRPPADRDRAAARYRQLLDSGELDAAGLFVAHDDDRTLRGVHLVQAMPGALGLTWTPVVPRRRNRTAVEDALISAACQWLRRRGVKVCQAFAGDAASDGMEALERHAFRRITRLVDLTIELDLVEPMAPSLTFEAVGPANSDSFAGMLLATFEGTLDCPEVTGSRTDAELLAGYTESAAPHQLWFLARQENRPVGVILLDDSHHDFELTYIGVAPIFRGCGFGSELVKFALLHAKKCGARTVVLSVDERNEPALRLYRMQGFQASGAHEVFLAHWPVGS